MQRLDPRHPPLWRDATTLQFGLADVARLDEPQAWELRLLEGLRTGMTDAAVTGMLRAAGVDEAAADAFFAEVQPVLRPVGTGPRVVVHPVPTIASDIVDAVARSLAGAGARVRIDPWPERPATPLEPEETVVVIAAYLVDPLQIARLMSADVRHLPLVFDDAGATVGPLVEPGETACLACDNAHARDRDPAWPVIASQLFARPCAVDPGFAAEAARAAAHLLSEPGAVRSRSLRLQTDSLARTWRAHPPHEECGCRSLAESATASAVPVPVRATSSPRAIARPA